MKFYSEKLDKLFDSEKELKKAEADKEAAEKEKEAKALAKKNEALVVNSAIDLYEEGKVSCNKIINEAYNEYKQKVMEAEQTLSKLENDAQEKLNDWLKDHPNEGFHYTYKSEDGKVVREYNYYNRRYDVFDNYNKFAEMIKKLWF